MNNGTGDKQHYVPQFYLKGWCPFSHGNKNKLKCVRAWNVDRGLISRPVSIRDECSRSDFYGPKGNPTDNWLSEMEASLSAQIWRLRCTAHRKPTENEERAIRIFMSIQRLRTRYGEREALELVMKSPDLFDNEQDKEFMKRHLPPGNFDMSGQIPNMASEAFIATQDMDFLIVVNDTDDELVTSDNPVAMWNHAFPKHLNMGLSDSGLAVILPVGPKCATVLYDRAAYANRSNGVRLKVTKCTPNDVQALNFMQACNCQNNLYFKNDHTDLAKLMANAESHRSRCTPYIARAISKTGDGDLLHLGGRQPNPRVRLSFLHVDRRFRRRFARIMRDKSTEFEVPQRETYALAKGAPSGAHRALERGLKQDTMSFRQVSKIELGAGFRG